MTQPLRTTLARRKAETLLKQKGIDALPVDPFAIAEATDIVVKPKAGTTGGVSGMLLRYGDAFGILYATHVSSEGFQRFSVAHELGHYFVDGHIDHVLPKGASIHTSHAGYVSCDQYELEADNFATGLLMPEALFRNALRTQTRSPGLSAVEALAGRCRTSLTATAIRYADLSDDPVAIIVSTGSTIDYCRLSESMKLLRELIWLKKGSPVPTKTATARLNAKSDRVARAERETEEIDILDWLGGVRSLNATEEVVGLGSYGKTLTILSCPSLQDQVDEEDVGEDEASLIESWTPRFRRK